MKKMLGILMVAGALAFAPAYTVFAEESEAMTEEAVVEEAALEMK